MNETQGAPEQEAPLTPDDRKELPFTIRNAVEAGPGVMLVVGDYLARICRAALAASTRPLVSEPPAGMRRDTARWQWFAAWWFKDETPPEGFLTAKTMEQLNAVIDEEIGLSPLVAATPALGARPPDTDVHQITPSSPPSSTGI